MAKNPELIECQEETSSELVDASDAKPEPVDIPKLKISEDNAFELDLSDAQRDTWINTLSDLSGCGSPDLGSTLLLNTIQASAQVKPANEGCVNAILNTLVSSEPHDPLEAMLISQAISCYQQSMDLMKCAVRTSLVGTREEYLKMSARLMRLFLNQMETLRRWKNKGTQTIRVEKIDKAIIGNIN